MQRPILGYTSVELAAAALALLSPSFISWSESVRDLLGLAPQLLVIAIYFLMITTLLGMSLPFAIEELLGRDESAKARGKIVSAFYGLNTLGAAGGCLLAGFVTIESFGLSATSSMGAALAMGAGLLSLTCLRSRKVLAAWSLSVVGSLGVGFVLLPTCGTRLTGLILVMLLIGLALVLLASESKARRICVVAFGACVLLHFSHNVPRELYEARIGPDTKILEFREGVESNVMVTENATMRKLWIGAIWVAGTGGPHEAFGHIPGLLVENPKRVLGIALGTGQTFAAVFKHGVEHFDCVDIDANVVELSRKWFGAANGGLLDNPRVTTHIADGRSFMRQSTAKYDMIVLEPLQSWTAGTTNLYTREFYEDARRLLNPGGVVAQWIPFYGQASEETRSMVRTGLDVFSHASLWLVQRDGVVVYSDSVPSLTPEVLDQRISERGIAGDLVRFPAQSAEDLLHFLLMGTRGLREWTAGADALVDDRPFLEFRAARAIGSPHKFLSILAAVRPFIDDVAEYSASDGSGQEQQISRIDRVRHIWLMLYFMDPKQHEKRVTMLESIGPDAAQSMHWQSMYQREILAWANSLAQQDKEAARAILDRGQMRLAPMPESGTAPPGG